MAASLTSVISANILPKRLKISKHTNYLTVAKSLVLVTSVNILPKRLKISKPTNLHTVAKSLMLVTSIKKYSSALAQALKRHKLTFGGERHCHSEENCLVRPSKENMSVPSS